MSKNNQISRLTSSFASFSTNTRPLTHLTQNLTPPHTKLPCQQITSSKISHPSNISAFFSTKFFNGINRRCKFFSTGAQSENRRPSDRNERSGSKFRRRDQAPQMSDDTETRRNDRDLERYLESAKQFAFAAKFVSYTPVALAKTMVELQRNHPVKYSDQNLAYKYALTVNKVRAIIQMREHVENYEKLNEINYKKRVGEKEMAENVERNEKNQSVDSNSDVKDESRSAVGDVAEKEPDEKNEESKNLSGEISEKVDDGKNEKSEMAVKGKEEVVFDESVDLDKLARLKYGELDVNLLLEQRDNFLRLPESERFVPSAYVALSEGEEKDFNPTLEAANLSASVATARIKNHGIETKSGFSDIEEVDKELAKRGLTLPPEMPEKVKMSKERMQKLKEANPEYFKDELSDAVKREIFKTGIVPGTWHTVAVGQSERVRIKHVAKIANKQEYEFHFTTKPFKATFNRYSLRKAKP